jgi:Zn-finger nucleic acid-binding protein
MSATIECLECRTVVDGAGPICTYCGAQLPHEKIALPQRACPRCREELFVGIVGETPVERCHRCYGVWLANDALAALVGNRHAQQEVVAAPEAEAAGGEIRVRPALCPDCRAILAKVAFAPGSTIEVDTCAAHGVWFDRAELQQAADFVLSGKLDAVRAAEQADRELEIAAGVAPTVIPPVERDPDLRPGALLPRTRRLYEVLGQLLNIRDRD